MPQDPQESRTFRDDDGDPRLSFNELRRFLALGGPPEQVAAFINENGVEFNTFSRARGKGSVLEDVKAILTARHTPELEVENEQGQRRIRVNPRNLITQLEQFAAVNENPVVRDAITNQAFRNLPGGGAILDVGNRIASLIPGRHPDEATGDPGAGARQAAAAQRLTDRVGASRPVQGVVELAQRLIRERNERLGNRGGGGF